MIEKANNVVLFPGVKSVFEPAPPSLEELRKHNIGLIVNQVNDLYLSLLKKYHIRADVSPEFLRDTSFIKEAVKSGANRASGMGHPFQNIADTMFEVSEDNESLEIRSVPMHFARVEEITE